MFVRLNDTGFVQTSYTDTLWMVRAMGLASKEAMIKKLPFTVYTWLHSDIEKKLGKHAWYNAPVAVMSQLMHPVSKNYVDFYLELNLLYCHIL